MTTPTGEPSHRWNLSIMEPYTAGGHQPFPLATLWINGRIVDQWPLGQWRKRVQWLPLWLPGNRWFDTSADAVLEKYTAIRRRCIQLAGQPEGEVVR